MKAPIPNDFRSAWQWHIDQLAHLALMADIEYKDYLSVKTELETWLNIANKRTHDHGKE
jgi:hypothetical protein